MFGAARLWVAKEKTAGERFHLSPILVLIISLASVRGGVYGTTKDTQKNYCGTKTKKSNLIHSLWVYPHHIPPFIFIFNNQMTGDTSPQHNNPFTFSNTSVCPSHLFHSYLNPTR